MFDPNDWVVRFKRNAERADMNSHMDSGWSASVAETCRLNAVLLYRELVEALMEVPIDPKDFFDRPTLAAVLSAVHDLKKFQSS